MSDENNMFEKNEQPQYSGEPAQPEYSQPSQGQPEYNQPSQGQPEYSQSSQGQPGYGGENQYTPNSGYAEPVVPENYGADQSQSNGLGVASMVCGIVALPIMCCTNVGSVISIILGIVAIVLGIVQLAKHGKKGMAIAGIICGALALVICVILLIIGVYMIQSGAYDEIMRQLEMMQ